MGEDLAPGPVETSCSPGVSCGAADAALAAALLALIAAAGGSGVALAFTWTPSVADAHASTAWIDDTTVGMWVRSLHAHAANGLAFTALLQAARMLWGGMYRGVGRLRWWRALALLGLLFLADFTGLLLPWDQNAVHGTSVRLRYVAEIPLAGEFLRNLLAGESAPDGATLSRFFALHALVIPVLLASVARGLWRESRDGCAYAVSAGALSAVLVVGLAAWLAPAPLGPSGDPGQPWPHARPEWYALPLYQVLRQLPAGWPQTLALTAPPLLGGVLLFGLPWFERVTKRPERLVRPALTGALVASLGLGLWSLAEDARDGEGRFHRFDAEELMTLMGRSNEALGNSAEPVPDDGYRAARDLIWLARKLQEVEERDENVSAEDWECWSDDVGLRARDLLLAPDDATRRRARAALRQACEECHQAVGEDEIDLEPRSRFITEPAPGGHRSDGAPEPVEFFSLALLDELKPTPVTERSALNTSRLMKQLRYRMRDLGHAGGLAPAEYEPKYDRSPEQHFVDLLHAFELAAAQAEENEGNYEPADWRRLAEETRAALKDLRDARRGEDFRRRFAALGRTCDDCHRAALEDEIDWRYEALYD